MTAEDPVLFGCVNQIGRLTFNRASTLNAMTFDMIEALGERLHDIAQRGDLRALILSGAGRAFMAGGDLRYLHEAGPHAPREAERAIEVFHAVMTRLAELPLPVIAQVHGVAAGAGLSIMLAADFVIAAEDTRFVFAYSHIGTSPDGGLSWALPRLIGLRKAMEFAFVSDVVTAKEALNLGMLTRSVPAEDVVCVFR